MNDKINGIIVAGKVYEVKDDFNDSACTECDLNYITCRMPHWAKCRNVIYKFSQELTDKLNTNGF